MTGAAPEKSDLGTRAASAVVMLAVAGAALWLGGVVWLVFVAAVWVGVFWEWRGLVARFERSAVRRGLWNAAGIVYVGLAALMLLVLRDAPDGALAVLFPLAAVIATDIGAYFAGRTFGGPKIAPRISPSKTWSGLAGGIVGASAALALLFALVDDRTPAAMTLRSVLILGPLAAIVAQAGDFFESWMKRRAGVKDSGKLLPGHGGLFDRTDGLIAVLFAMSIVGAGTIASYIVAYRAS